VKTASPEMFDLAPKDLPWKTGPSYTVSVSKDSEISRQLSTTYPDCERGTIVRDRSGTRTGHWHSTSSASLNGSQKSDLLANSPLDGKARRFEGRARRLQKTTKHVFLYSIKIICAAVCFV
jgi:hypothetical protein